ncbi:hypothetical protein CC78DRAFT_494731 [Lojkania enalia]|uniref:Uncharacterized protein n=1 Tax=Lojkania enalia TaxID=147567 RepID=A0A9P4KAA7_9PLEO|nr:hypothetical protein CC78DRAFT_494731 [Didymosphaeria enalia]
MISPAWPIAGVLIALVACTFVPDGFVAVLAPRFSLNRYHVLSFFYGILFIPILRLILSRLWSVEDVQGHKDGSRSSVYGLDHGRLNLDLPPSMWMNMGYWHNESGDGRPMSFPAACEALLREVLRTAGFEENRQSSSGLQRHHRFRVVIDLGFGCADQTVSLMKNTMFQSPLVTGQMEKIQPFRSYIGITLDRKQFQYAEQRVRDLPNSSARLYANTQLFCADAASPNAWPKELRETVEAEATDSAETWVLALDTLYHFSPSRWPVIFYASQHLQASFMAFDLCIADHVAVHNRVLLRVLTKVMGAPWANFVTAEQYRTKLIEAGYKDVTVNDISEHVFEPLANFLDDRHRRLRFIGYGLGSFHAAKWMFRWWANSGVMRGIVVVAKQ